MVDRPPPRAARAEAGRPRRTTRLVALVVAVVVGAASLVATSPSAGAGPPIDLRDGYGIHIDWSNRRDPRTLDIGLRAASIDREAGVRILLPTGYDRHPARRYPVLYLLHGGGGTSTDWTNGFGATDATRDADAIVVMPDGGKGGWYTDWDNFGSSGPPRWETFHIRSLIPWVDANLRTIATRHGRAIAGLSMGGYGAMNYAGRHPDLFVAVSAYSGAVDIDNPALRALISVSPIIDGMAPGRIYGVYPFDSTRRRRDNPWSLAPSYRGMRVDLYTGNGRPGPLDPPGDPLGSIGAAVPETVVHAVNLRLDARLTSLGIAHTLHDYGDGQHRGAYWARDLVEDLPGLLAALDRARG